MWINWKKVKTIDSILFIIWSIMMWLSFILSPASFFLLLFGKFVRKLSLENYPKKNEKTTSNNYTTSS